MSGDTLPRQFFPHPERALATAGALIFADNPRPASGLPAPALLGSHGAGRPSSSLRMTTHPSRLSTKRLPGTNAGASWYITTTWFLPCWLVAVNLASDHANGVGTFDAFFVEGLAGQRPARRGAVKTGVS